VSFRPKMRHHMAKKFHHNDTMDTKEENTKLSLN
jgi:hypothetical protein